MASRHRSECLTCEQQIGMPRQKGGPDPPAHTAGARRAGRRAIPATGMSWNHSAACPRVGPDRLRQGLCPPAYRGRNSGSWAMLSRMVWWGAVRSWSPLCAPVRTPMLAATPALSPAQRSLVVSPTTAVSRTERVPVRVIASKIMSGYGRPRLVSSAVITHAIRSVQPSASMS